jgi:hypothetical protein
MMMPMSLSVFLLISIFIVVHQSDAYFKHCLVLSSPSYYDVRHSATEGRLTTSSLATSASTEANSISYGVADLQNQKLKLIELCKRAPKPPREEVNKYARDLESLGEQIGVGQGSSYSGLMAGEWELLYSPSDITRSSPFFWAFCKAFPEKSSDIFAITDAIPAPLKEVGPAMQTITLDTSSSSGELGKLVSRIKVSTFGGAATSMMTTRATIIGSEKVDGLKLRIDTTKPEDSTLLKKLGSFGELLDEQWPPFPSGEALERVKRGSSEVLMMTTYCDESIRISRNAEDIQDAFVWRRTSFKGVSEV